MDVPAFLIEMFPPDRDALLRHLAPMMTHPMQRSIVEADPGSRKARWTMVRSLVDHGRLPADLDVYQTEALELTRWDHPDDGSHPAERRRRHITRAFACNALMIATLKPWDMSDGGVSETLAAATASALAISPEAAACLAKSALSIRTEYPWKEELPFFALSVSLIAVFNLKMTMDEKQIRELVDWLIAEERVGRASPDRNTFPDEHPNVWLLGLTNFNQYHFIWQRLIDRVLALRPNDFLWPGATNALKPILEPALSYQWPTK